MVAKESASLRCFIERWMPSWVNLPNFKLFLSFLDLQTCSQTLSNFFSNPTTTTKKTPVFQKVQVESPGLYTGKKLAVALVNNKKFQAVELKMIEKKNKCKLYILLKIPSV